MFFFIPNDPSLEFFLLLTNRGSFQKGLPKILKKVILLTIDTLSSQMLGAGENHPSPSKYIDSLMNNNLTFTNSFTSGCPTQMSFPVIMTSTYPLDYGGYESGIKDRPKTISEVFNDNNFKTTAFTSGSGTEELFFYDRGFDEFYSLTDLAITVNSYKRTMEYYINKDLSRETISFLVNKTGQMLAYCMKYPSNKLDMLKKGFLRSEIIFNWDLQSLKRFIELENDKFLDEEVEYTLELLKTDSIKFYDKINDFRIKRKKFKAINGELCNKFLVEFKIFRLRIKSQKFIKRFRSFLRLLVRTFTNYLESRFVPGKYVIDNSLNWIKDNSEKDFFLWVHITDLHDETIFCDSTHGQEFAHEVIKNNNNYVNEVRKYKSYNRNLRYDLSIRLTDQLIEYFFEQIYDLGIQQETLIVLTSDHGPQTTGLSDRICVRTEYEKTIGLNERGHSTDFFDELYGVPTIFIHPQLSKVKRKDFFSSIDLTPTILGLANINYPRILFKGNDKSKSYYDKNYIIMENLGPGPANFYDKPIRIALRRKKIKVICQKRMNHELEVLQVYNLSLDPMEKTNLVESEIDNPEVHIAINIIRKRIIEITKIQNKF